MGAWPSKAEQDAQKIISDIFARMSPEDRNSVATDFEFAEANWNRLVTTSLRSMFPEDDVSIVSSPHVAVQEDSFTSSFVGSYKGVLPPEDPVYRDYGLFVVTKRNKATGVGESHVWAPSCVHGVLKGMVMTFDRQKLIELFGEVPGVAGGTVPDIRSPQHVQTQMRKFFDAHVNKQQQGGAPEKRRRGFVSTKRTASVRRRGLDGKMQSVRRVVYENDVGERRVVRVDGNGKRVFVKFT